MQKAYINALLQEIRAQKGKYEDRKVISVYLGGGTPSLLKAEDIERIFYCLREVFTFAYDAEISIEVNPGTANTEKFKIYKQIGINRLSIGLQSAKDDELELLGRIHNFSQFKSTYEAARECGFDNINIDLISSLPGQSIKDYMYSLEKVISLNPEHISAYSLQLEEGTYLYDHMQDYEWIDEDTDRQLYKLTGQVLKDNGYHRYEISNYSKDGYECSHNTVYWRRGNYLGLGLGASSLIDEVRFKNTDDINDYIDGHFDLKEVHKLEVSEQMEEFMFLGLRLTNGLMEEKFKDTFGVDIDEVYGKTINELVRDGLLIRDDTIRLTEYGLDVSNYIFAKFLL